MYCKGAPVSRELGPPFVNFNSNGFRNVICRGGHRNSAWCRDWRQSAVLQHRDIHHRTYAAIRIVSRCGTSSENFYSLKTSGFGLSLPPIAPRPSEQAPIPRGACNFGPKDSPPGMIVGYYSIQSAHAQTPLPVIVVKARTSKTRTLTKEHCFSFSSL